MAKRIRQHVSAVFVYGTIRKGSAIRLARCADALGVAEGIGIALAVTRDRGIPVLGRARR